MNIVFIHFHLKPGGVTRVVQEQIAACRLLGHRPLVLAGDNQAGLDLVQVLPELHYDIHRNGTAMGPDSGNGGPPAGSGAQGTSNGSPDGSNSAPLSGNGAQATGGGAQVSRNSAPVASNSAPEADNAAPSAANGTAAQLAERIEAAALAHFGVAPDLYHVHNPLLGKNEDLLPALAILRDRGARILLQIHDLAEDRRPDVYIAAPYPDGVHYAFLNSRDYSRFHQAGIPDEALHLLPNQVRRLPERPKLRTEPSGRRPNRYLLYPVRAIPRKNLGEAIALALLLDDLEVRITLPPNNPAHEGVYSDWKRLAGELQAPVVFEAGQDSDFAELLGNASGVVTTSVQEGFGFAFLEAWTVGVPVFGRNLPDITCDFASEGIDLSFLYKELRVPNRELDPEFSQRWVRGARDQLAWFRKYSGGAGSAGEVLGDLESDLEAAFERMFRGQTIDFARLDRPAQVRVLHDLADERTGLRSRMRGLNPDLVAIEARLARLERGSDCAEARIIEANRRRVTEAWGIEKRSGDLEAVYRKVLDTDPGRFEIDKAVLLASYLGPRQYFPAAEFTEPESEEEAVSYAH